jgi:hypothetical protein
MSQLPPQLAARDDCAVMLRLKCFILQHPSFRQHTQGRGEATLYLGLTQ